MAATRLELELYKEDISIKEHAIHSTGLELKKFCSALIETHPRINGAEHGTDPTSKRCPIHIILIIFQLDLVHTRDVHLRRQDTILLILKS